MTVIEQFSAHQQSRAVISEAGIPCRDLPELWFADRPGDVELAKSLCHGCPIRQSCLDGARERREPWGVWGGELFHQGQVVPRKRSRGRPRKTELAEARPVLSPSSEEGGGR